MNWFYLKMLLRGALTCLLLSAIFTQTALAQISITPKDSAERSFYFEIPAGQEASGTLKITNILDQETLVKIYGVDATQSKDGILAFTTLDSAQKSIGLWTKSSEEKVLIGKKETKEAQFKINIPQNTPPGVYIGAIAVQEINKTEKNNNSKQVDISARVVSKIYVKVPGKITHQYQWQSLKLDQDTENEISAQIENSGNSLLTTEGEITINNLLTGSSSVLKTGQANIFAHETKKISVAWKNPPLFGLVKIKGQFTFGRYDFLTRKSLDKKVENKEIILFLIPTSFKISLAVIVILVASWLIFRRFKHKQSQQNSLEYKVGKGETLNSIAAKFQINWKELARVNKLKAPYTVRVNDLLLIPHETNKKTK